MDKVFVDELNDLLGSRFSTSESVRSNYSKGEDIFDPILPSAVAFPKYNRRNI